LIKQYSYLWQAVPFQRADVVAKVEVNGILIAQLVARQHINRLTFFLFFLEKKSGVNSKLLSKYENGRIIPTADTLRKLAEGLDISADYLINDR